MSETIILMGASVRAAAFSALAAGVRPVCGDLFADADLAARACVTAVRPYPAGFRAFANAAPPGPWMYTGALENEPELVDRISRRRPLYGNPGQVLARVRDPLAVQKALAQAGLDTPECRSTTAGLPRDGSWLCKPLNSSGGRRVQVLTTKTPTGLTNSACYFQRCVEGLPCAAVYVAAGGDSRLLGVTEQLLRPARHEMPAFCYSGSIGPLRLPERARVAFDQIGRVLSGEFALTGIFGVDAILNDESVWPVEVNPRYTASVEVLERALAFSAVGWHIATCCEGRLPTSLEVSTWSRNAKWCGKQLLFATADVGVTRQYSEHALRQNIRPDEPVVADIPSPGTRLTAGQPVLTVLGEAQSHEDLRTVLAERLRGWESTLYAGCPASG